MRVLITNSLVLAAISLAPSASAAPYSATSSVDTYESYPNSTALAQEPGPSSVPNVRRDEIIHVQSLYDESPFGHVFGPVAALFGTIGMNTISDNLQLSDAQKTVLDQLHDALTDAAGSVAAHLPPGLPISPLSSRSLEDVQIQGPLAVLRSQPVLGDTLAPLLNLLSSAGLATNPTAPLTDVQKQVLTKLQAAISSAVGGVTASVPKLAILPFDHQARSVEERSLPNIVSTINQVPFLGVLLSPVTSLISSLGVTDGTPLDDVQKQVLSMLQGAISEAVEDIKAHAPTIHTEKTRAEPEHSDHHDHHRDPHGDDPHSHDDHKDGHKPHDAHKEDRKSPNVHNEDRHVQDAHRGDDHCREPRDGQQDDRHWRGGCEHNKGEKDGDGDSLLKISLGHAHHS